MENYGIKTSKKGADATSANNLDIIMTTQYPFAKIDPTKAASFQVTTVTLLRDPPANTATTIYSFAHGYTYTPEMWGLWNVTWGTLSLMPGKVQNGYGTIFSSTGAPASTIAYSIDATNVNLILTFGTFGGGDSLIGSVFTLTSYVFADDLQPQDYTV